MGQRTERGWHSSGRWQWMWWSDSAFAAATCNTSDKALSFFCTTAVSLFDPRLNLICNISNMLKHNMTSDSINYIAIILQIRWILIWISD